MPTLLAAARLHLPLALGACLVATSSFAASQACTSIVDDVRRLACFDRLHGTPSRAGAPPSAADGEPSGLPPTRVAPGLALAGQAAAVGESSRLFELRPYRGTYLLPVSHTDNPNRRPQSPPPGHDVGLDLPNRAVEAKFQFSARMLAWRGVFGDAGHLWLAYTQSSRWQIYQADISRPFRETNYEPELSLIFTPQATVLGWEMRHLGLTLNHQSNGRALPLSRSWNRLVGELGLQQGAWSVNLRPWLRLSERPEKDDNPDIGDHLGRAEFTLARQGEAGSLLQLRMRHSLRGGSRSRGSAEVDWAFPLSGRLQGYVQLFSGYGESLIDYNIRQTRIGLGFALAGWP